MHDLLRRHEINAVREELSDNMIYRVLRKPCADMVSQMRTPWLSVEDVVLECLSTLDMIKADFDEALTDMDTFWTATYNDFRYQAPPTVSEDEMQLATDVTCYSSMLMLSCSSNRYYNTELLSMLSNEWQKHAKNPASIVERFTPTVARIGRKFITQAVDEYMESYVFLSDALDDMLCSLEEPTARTASLETVTKNGKGMLTNRQLIILMENLLDVSAGYSQNASASAFGDFLAKVSGNSASSIRQLIPNGGIDYNPESESKAKAIAADVDKVAALIEPFSPKKAAQIRNLIH